MPDAHDVTPGKWSGLTILFDNGSYSVAHGTFEPDSGNTKKALGVRWNGSGDHPGFPNQGGNSLWHVVPEFLTHSIIHGLIDELAQKEQYDQDERMNAIISILKSHAGSQKET